LLMTLCVCTSAIAQQATVKGTVRDTSEQKIMPNAVVAVLKKSDSTLSAFTRSDKDGAFVIKNIPPGDYLLMVTYPRFADYVEPFSLRRDSLRSTDTLLQMGTLGLIRKSKLLEEVIISQKVSAIRMKGDTLEFKADSFKVKEGASVEELLKKLPGIQVNSKGEITAQGQKVKKVLVDGEEFFGDDPTLVTQNLRADMVDKVQVYDKKSDQAAFTGIDDGDRSRTINLKLKEDKKKGFFGKIAVGQATDGYYDHQAMMNFFRKKQKLSFYGIASSTGKTGLNWDERDNYGQSTASMLEYDESTGWFSFNGPGMDDIESWDGRYNGQGYPKVKTGGIHYSNKWDEEKQNLNINYKAMQLLVEGQNGTNSQYILPDSNGGKNQFSTQSQRFDNEIMRHRANGMYEVKFDSTSTLKFTADGGNDHRVSFNHYDSKTLAADSARINESNRDVNTTGDTRSFNSNLMWRRKLPKKGRTLAVSFEEKYQLTSSDGYINAQNYFYKQDTLNSKQFTDQYKNFHGENFMLGGKIAYTEPLSQSSFLSVNYGLSVNNSTSDRSSFNKSSTGKYTELDPIYSNDYGLNTLTHSTGVAYSLMQKKLKLTVGGNVGSTHFEQVNRLTDSSVVRRFTNWYPQASFNYSFSQQQRLMVMYNGRTQQPTVQQIQPVRTNDDPLNIAIGNPALKPSFTNTIWMNYNDYKVLNERYIYTGFNFDQTVNQIVNKTNTDTATGKSTYQSVNLNGNYSFSVNFGYNFKWKKPGLGIGFETRYARNRFTSIVNEVVNATNSDNYNFNIDLYKEVEKKYDIGLTTSAGYTHSVSSIQAANTTSYWTYNIQPRLGVYFPWKIELHADADIR
ncbi:MAG: TonB-dependent receptor, partial [Bacteroidetes bacterium]|nr:TonB-dependent receptor [Bacteroidota bacterium]